MIQRLIEVDSAPRNVSTDAAVGNTADTAAASFRRI